ncbi:hypothetical protein [Sphingobium sp. CCH11-B1]|uniref:hypothetical protein n=1 Tax=Sphingobium sp. CCH11-B1 TaxID=1768781 RepID=UPI00083028B5|nr:hypothetical protein [Sphingobium sp. CCH11-B1]
MSDIERIAAGLSKEQSAFLLSLPADGSAKRWPDGMAMDEMKGLRGFGQSGLIRSWYGDAVEHALSDTGLAVRAHLENSDAG